MTGLDQLSVVQRQVLNALGTRDATGHPEGLHASQLAAISRAQGDTIDAGVGDIDRQLRDLTRAGLAESYRRTSARGSKSARRYIITDAGKNLLNQENTP